MPMFPPQSMFSICVVIRRSGCDKRPLWSHVLSRAVMCFRSCAMFNPRTSAMGRPTHLSGLRVPAELPGVDGLLNGQHSQKP